MTLEISYEYVREIFNYDPETGIVTNKIPKVRKGIVDRNSVVGRKDLSGAKGSEKLYLRVYVNGKNFYLHRIIWVLMTGEQPEFIDHIDGNGLNNKWENIRNVSHLKNSHNQKIHKNNTSGASGVTYRKDSNRWRARIKVDGTMISLGTFETFDEAKTARMKAESLYYD